MLDALSTGFASIMTCVGTFVAAIFETGGALTALMPAIGLALGYGAVKFGIRVVKDIVPNV